MNVMKKKTIDHSWNSVLLILLFGFMPLTSFAEDSGLGGLGKFVTDVGEGVSEMLDGLVPDFFESEEEQNQKESHTASSGPDQIPEQTGSELPVDPMDFLVMDPTQLELPSFPKSCGVSATLSVGEEIFLNKNPTVESAFDRVNTGARFLHLGELLIHLPISAGSQWPKDVNNELPSGNFLSTFFDIFKGNLVSLNKLRGDHILGTLFSKAPDFDSIPRYTPYSPSEPEVQQYGARVLGPKFNPEFNVVFDWLLRHYPDFEPKPEIFVSDLNGEPTEIFPSIVKAVRSLAENQEDLLKIEEEISIAHHTNISARKDVEETLWQIRNLKKQQLEKASSTEESVQNGQPNEMSHEDNGVSEELAELKEEFQVQQLIYEESVRAYELALNQLELAVNLIKKDQTKLEMEEQALAQNIQHVVEGTQKLICGSELETLIAAKHLVQGIPNLHKDLGTLVATGQSGVKRMQRIVLNLIALPWNVKTITIELGLLNKRIDIYDGLFEDRLE